LWQCPEASATPTTELPLKGRLFPRRAPSPQGAKQEPYLQLRTFDLEAFCWLLWGNTILFQASVNPEHPRGLALTEDTGIAQLIPNSISEIRITGSRGPKHFQLYRHTDSHHHYRQSRMATAR